LEIVKASAPANLALIKYMGKLPAINSADSDRLRSVNDVVDSSKNIAANPSLSISLENFITSVEIHESAGLTGDTWQPLFGDGLLPFELSHDGQNRFLKFWQILKNTFSIEGNYIVKSGNNFPSDCGLASSSSSFAALTQAAYNYFLKHKNNRDWTKAELADLSRSASGSSGRSFFQPWCLWQEDGFSGLELKHSGLSHLCVVVDKAKKLVSSSEAHRRVNTSLLYAGRSNRAQIRLQKILTVLEGDVLAWKSGFEIIWSEFWDMHCLFETSTPSFDYMSSKSVEVLRFIKEYWLEKGDGPWVTMDAGSNVHLIFRQDQRSMEEEIKSNLNSFSVLKGIGK